jgi:hypothetical protein
MILLSIGCAQNIPLRKDTPTGEQTSTQGTEGVSTAATLKMKPVASARKLGPHITIHMTKELRDLVVRVKPSNIPLSNSYDVPIGDSLASNLEATVGSLFETTSVSTDLDTPAGKGATLDVVLKEHEFNIALSVFGTHTARLLFAWTLYDESGGIHLPMNTETSGSNKMTSGELMVHLLPLQTALATGYRASIGRAVDDALGKAIDQIITAIQKAYKGNNSAPNQ